MTSDRALLSGLIDYAGLFPPASLDLAAAVDEFRSARGGPNGWVVHRFLCPASRLSELAAMVSATMTSAELPWSIGCIVDGPLGAAIADAQAFEAEMAPGATISAVEAKLSVVARTRPDGDRTDAAASIVDAAATLGDAVFTYVEVDLDGDPVDDVAAIADVARSRRRVAAKVRCGGPTPESIPSTEALGAVLVAAAAVRLPLKATAGLHHPVRHIDSELGVPMHGFLNVAVAEQLALAGADLATVVEALGELEPASFAFRAGGLDWRHHHLPTRTLQETRAIGLHGFGSCSFDEPIADLIALGVPGIM